MGILTINTENSKVGISFQQNVFEVDKTEMKHVSPTAENPPVHKVQKVHFGHDQANFTNRNNEI